MNHLTHIIGRLKEERGKFNGIYYIPEAWNTAGYAAFDRNPRRQGEISVNPYDFILFNIDYCLQHQAPFEETDPSRLGESAMYSMLPRMFTAWNHGEDEAIAGGTFLKAICLLPFLKSMHIDIIYLLPIFKHSSKYKKGEIGSPYAIKNVYEIDSELHDPLLGGDDSSLVETEFKAFIEACHLFGMKVMLDFVFRTVSRDNDLILSHPDWFYWIDVERNGSFRTPSVDKEKPCTMLNDRSLRSLYKSADLGDYLSMFSLSPDQVDPDKWEVVKQEHIRSGRNLLDLIEEQFRLTTVPGFPNVLNDPQPPWTDITYLRFYYDTHRKAKKYTGSMEIPYIIQDGVSLNLYPGEAPNRELWSYVADVIPYYQRAYGIDGARIDMGHALPTELNREIMAKAGSKHFILWSEEFDVIHSGAAKEDGYHFISGFVWDIYKSIEKSGFNHLLIRETQRAEIPVIASLETPDTPRAALLHKDRKRYEQLVLLNSFLPNSVPFINNGMELLEIQPMNLGLDNTEEGRLVLDPGNPMYGKLAFFDPYRMHWLSGDREWGSAILGDALGLRKRFGSIVARKDNLVEQPEVWRKRNITFLCYVDGEQSTCVFVLANRRPASSVKIDLGKLLPEQAKGAGRSIRVVYAGGRLCEELWSQYMPRVLEPGETVIGSIEL